MKNHLNNRIAKIECEIGISSNRSLYQISDGELESILRNHLGKPEGYQFSDSELIQIASLPTA